MTSKILSGAWQPKKSSSAIDRHNGAAATLAGDFGAVTDAPLILFLLLLGVLTVVLHASFHWPLQLPGHHGLEVMALMVFGRGLTKRPWAATAVAAGAGVATLIPVLAPNDLSAGWQYLLIGIVVDGLFRAGAPWRHNALFLAAIAALAHAAKPFSKWLLFQSVDLHFGSLRDGLLIPLSSHLAFGFVGGLIGALMAIATQRALTNRH